MNALKQTAKKNAIRYMKMLDMADRYIKAFKRHNKVYIFENFKGTIVSKHPDVEAKKRELEEYPSVVVYAITHEYTLYGEIYNFFIAEAPTDDEELYDEFFISEYGLGHLVAAYGWNRTCSACSEPGEGIIESRHGGVRRIDLIFSDKPLKKYLVEPDE